MHKSNPEDTFKRLELISEWLVKHQQGRLAPEEYAQLREWLDEDSATRETWLVGLQNLETQRRDLELFHRFDSNKRPDRILGQVGARVSEKPRLRMIRRMIRVAASLLLLSGIGLLVWKVQDRSADQRPDGSARHTYLQDKAPGKNQAFLTLNDGTVLQLDTNQSGILVTDQLQYPDGKSIADERLLGEAAPSTDQELALTTPKGGQYQITLEDGTEVWLNAGSTLRYPMRFSGDQRLVYLEGEAYFEVSEMERKPFIVVTGPQRVEVLGTSFNINAYQPDERIRTTLLTGKVRLEHEAESRELSPGQQGIVAKKGDIVVQRVIVEDVVAWKDGYFMFNNEPLEDVMAKVGKWYDLDIEFGSPALKNEKVYGTISRSENLSQVLLMLEKADVADFEVTREVIRVKKRK